MKRGALNFLGRKNQSLFDTNIKIKDMDNVQLVLDSPVIPESGTASVRARPTVKHHASSDSFQGFAVPTPKVPLLPPATGPKVNGSVGGAQLSNGSVISVPELVEGEIFVPPPPSMAPPPPPETFIPPPPDFMGDLKLGPDLGTSQPPSIPAANPTSPASSMEVDLASLKPPAMAPPKPPSTCSTSTSLYTPVSSPEVPEHPKFAPPQPPIERPKKTYKTPPPKPIRLSSIPTLDSPPHTPAPPPPVQTPTPSSFNPQNKAKLYNVPKPSILSSDGDHDTKPKQMLLLEDSGSVNTPPVLVQVDGKVPKVATPSNPVSKDVQELKENLQITQPSQPPLPIPNKEAATVTISEQQETAKPVQTPPQTLTQIQGVNSTQLNLEPSKDKLQGPPSQSRKISPLLDKKLRNLKGSEPNGAREGHSASPLALLMAAKEREKQKLAHAVSQDNTAKKNEQQSASIHPSDSSPNSFVVIPKSSSSSTLTSQERIQESSKPASPAGHVQLIQTPTVISSSSQIRNQVPSTTPAHAQFTSAASPSVTNPVEQKQNAELSSSKSQFAQPKNNSEGLSIPLLPPPPEFDDLDTFMEPPPSIRPPDPPVKKAKPMPTVTIPPLAPVPALPVSLPPPAPHVTLPPPAPPVSLPPPAPPVSLPPPASVSTPTVIPPPPPPAPSPSSKPKLTTSPKLPAPDNNVKPKHPVQTKTQVAPTQLPSTLSPSQATLLSILQKKMLEMDHKMAPVKEPESSCDDWNGPLSDEENNVPVVPKATPQSKNYPAVNKAATLDMRELESKVVKKTQQTSSVKVPTSNGPSKHPYGLTFTVRPGTKQPITLASKGESN